MYCQNPYCGLCAEIHSAYVCMKKDNNSQLLKEKEIAI